MEDIKHKNIDHLMGVVSAVAAIGGVFIAYDLYTAGDGSKAIYIGVATFLAMINSRAYVVKIIKAINAPAR